MAKAYHESLHPLGNLGIQVSMAALEIHTFRHTGTKHGDLILPERIRPYSCRTRTSYSSAQSTDCF